MSQPRNQSRIAFFPGSRVAFFGGSFDPPHLGHLAVARAARTALRLDTVLFAPVGTQPLKPQGAAASFEDRLAMTQLAIAGEPGFSVSLADAPNHTPNYTIDTLKGLRAELPPDSALLCLMGADSFFSLHRWHRAAEIPFVAPLIVASRPGLRLTQRVAAMKAALPHGLTLESTPGGDSTESGIELRVFAIINAAGDRAPFYLLPGLDVEISASEIRKEIRAQVDAAAGTRGLLPKRVAEYVRSRGLYH